MKLTMFNRLHIYEGTTLVYFFPASIQSSPNNCFPISLSGSTFCCGVRYHSSLNSTCNQGRTHSQVKLINILMPLANMIGSGRVWIWTWKYIAPGAIGSFQEIDVALNQKLRRKTKFWSGIWVLDHHEPRTEALGLFSLTQLSSLFASDSGICVFLLQLKK